MLFASAADAIVYLLFAFTVFAILLSVGLALFALAWTMSGRGSARAPVRRV